LEWKHDNNVHNAVKFRELAKIKSVSGLLTVIEKD
jgi:hypothetical protein